MYIEMVVYWYAKFVCYDNNVIVHFMNVDIVCMFTGSYVWSGLIEAIENCLLALKNLKV